MAFLLDGGMDDEAAHSLERGLYVEPLNYPFDRNQCPTNAQEYISIVRQERAEMHPEESEECVMITLDERDRTTVCPSDEQNLKEWKTYQARRFSQHALRIKSQRARLMAKFPRGQLPPVADEKDVCLFCLGPDLYKNIYGDINVNNNVTGPHPPYLSVVLHLSQEEILSLLKNLSEWSFVIGMNRMICMWIYAILAVLNKPVSEECGCFLEELYDKCKQQVIKENGESKKRLRLISAILYYYFVVKVDKIGPPLERFCKAH